MGTYSKNIINIELTAEDKTNGVIAKTAKSVHALNKTTGRMNKVGEEYSKTVSKKLKNGMTQLTKTTNKVTSSGKRYTQSTSSMSKATERFNMNALGIMFAGMAMNRTFANLNATSREWLGIGELTSTMMGITMLDANMALLEQGVLPLFDALTNLPAGAQQAIGYTALALEGLGAIFMTGGQMMLGLGAFQNQITKMSGEAGSVAGLGKIAKNVTSQISKAINSNLGRGIAVTGAIMFVASDIFWEEEGNFEWDKKLGASALAAMATKGGLAAKAKAGVVVFTVLAAIEIAMDPEGFGVTVANIETYFDNILDLVDDGAGWLADSVKALVLKTEMPKVPKSWSEWQDNFDKGHSSTKLSLFESGKMTREEASYYGYSKTAGGQGTSTAFPEASEAGKNIFSNTYNVNVSDKREFEQMLKKNNDSLTSQVRRMAKV